MTARRGLLLPLLLGPALLFAGCWSWREPEQLAVVTAAAFDRLPTGAVRWTVEVPQPGGAGATAFRQGGQGGQPAVLFLQASGADATAAERSLARVVDRQLFWTHANFLLIGEGAARAGLSGWLDFVMRRYDLRNSSPVFLTRGEAGQLLPALTSPFDGTVAGALRNQTRLNRPEALPIFDVNTLTRVLSEPGVDPYPPVLSLTGGQPGKIRLERAAMQGDRLVGYFSEEAVQGIEWLRDEASIRLLSVPCPGPAAAGSVGVRLLRAISDLDWPAPVGAAGVVARIRVRGQLDHWDCPALLDAAQLRQVEGILAARIGAQVSQAVDEMRRFSVDPVGFGLRLHRTEPARWRLVAAEWRSWLQRLRVDAEVRVELLETGLKSGS